jgi:choline dehydrogenase-like flavoprotein
MAQVAPRSDVHDVVIIGSGAGGGTVTKVLADLGVKVLLMEAGPMVSMSDFKMLRTPASTVWHRGAGEQAQYYTGGAPTPINFNAGFAANIADEPYTVAPGSSFRWFRSRVIGGRTNHYSRVQLRYADYDFKPRDFDGLGWNWPITYADIAPYYDKAERLIGVTGKAEGLRSAPDGIFQEPAALRPGEILVQRAAAKLGIKAINARQAVLTKAQDGRPACHYCGQCMRGCGTASNYASSYVQIFPAMKTGNVTVLTNAMARELITDDSGRVTAISYVDRTTGTEQQVKCRTVVLSAAACESARLLLNSKSPRHPQGLANENGQVGRYLTDTVGFGLSGQVPALADTPVFNSDGYGPHLYIPWWMLDRHKELDFPRGYHVEIGAGGFGMPGLGFGAGTYNRVEGYGLAMKQAIRDGYGSTTVSFSGRGAMIPNEDCYCEIDPDVKDKWGIPVLRFHWKWSDHEINQVRHQRATFTALIEAMGGTVNPPQPFGPQPPGPPPGPDDPPRMGPGGGVIHEVGCVRMGDDPKTSVLDRWCRAHHVPNLFVADGGPFVSHADKNPTHTIIALAWRTAEHLAEELKKANV